MDYRLDLFNAIHKYQENCTEDDSIFTIIYNKKDGDLILTVDGDEGIFGAILGTDDFVNLATVEDRVRFEHVKKVVLNMAVNILQSDNDKLDIIKNHFKLKN